VLNGGLPVGPQSCDQTSYEDEVENASIAIREELRDGKTDRRCLRCGGRFIYEVHGTADIIRCENGDFKMVARAL
jgi:hypothetical protein